MTWSYRFLPLCQSLAKVGTVLLWSKGILCANHKHKSSRLKLNVSSTQLPLFSFSRTSLASSVPPEMRGSVTRGKSKCRDSYPTQLWFKSLTLENTSAIDGPKEGLRQARGQGATVNITFLEIPLHLHLSSTHPFFFFVLF